MNSRCPRPVLPANLAFTSPRADSDFIPYSKCCDFPVNVIIKQDGDGSINCTNPLCQRRRLKTFRVRNQMLSLTQRQNQFYEIGQPQGTQRHLIERYNKQVSNAVASGRYKVRNVSFDVHRANRQLSDNVKRSIFDEKLLLSFHGKSPDLRESGAQPPQAQNIFNDQPINAKSNRDKNQSQLYDRMVQKLETQKSHSVQDNHPRKSESIRTENSLIPPSHLHEINGQSSSSQITESLSQQ